MVIYKTILRALSCFVVYRQSPTGQNGRRFADDIFKCIYINEKSCILFRISLNFVTVGLIDNSPALV